MSSSSFPAPSLDCDIEFDIDVSDIEEVFVRPQRPPPRAPRLVHTPTGDELTLQRDLDEVTTVYSAQQMAELLPAASPNRHVTSRPPVSCP